MCAACRAESFWDSICDTPCDFPLRVFIVSWRSRPPPCLLGSAASASARHAAGASFAAWRLLLPLFPQHWTFCWKGTPCEGAFLLLRSYPRNSFPFPSSCIPRPHLTATRLWDLGLLECPRVNEARACGPFPLLAVSRRFIFHPLRDLEIKLPSF